MNKTQLKGRTTKFYNFIETTNCKPSYLSAKERKKLWIDDRQRVD